MLERTFLPNVAQRGDALALLQSLPDSCTPLAFFDPQFRELLVRQSYGNEGERQSPPDGPPQLLTAPDFRLFGHA
jgi:hypothetical protein